jgi:hypothetical protein
MQCLAPLCPRAPHGACFNLIHGLDAGPVLSVDTADCVEQPG